MELLEFQLPVWLSITRTALVYLLVCAFMRLVPKRHAGRISPQDVVGAVIVGGLTVGAIADQRAGPSDFLLMIGVVLGLNYLLDALGGRFPWLHRLLKEPATRLVHDGTIDREALRQEMLTEEELRGQLRKLGVGDIAQVRDAFLETSGDVSVVPNENPPAADNKESRSKSAKIANKRKPSRKRR
jgi:uncharacterized membrane protein YcaP (DUF421 family)